jgi:lipoprotein-anchoring transpeptidase ErfK/SrfK
MSTLKRTLSNAVTQPISAANAIDLGATQPVPRLHRREAPYLGRWRFWATMFISAGAAIVAGVVLAMAAGWGLFQASDTIAPGVEVLGVSVAGLTVPEATQALEDAWQQQTIVLVVEEDTYAVSPEMLGIGFDAEATAQAAYSQYRDLPAIGEVLGIGQRVPVAPAISLDPAMTEANLRILAPRFAVAPVNADLQVSEGRAEVVPPVVGRAVDVPETVARLVENVEVVVEAGQLTLMTTAIQPPVTDVDAALAQANDLLALTLAIRAYDPLTDETSIWTATPDVWGSWLSLWILPEDPNQLNWNLDDAQTAAFLSDQAVVLGADRYIDLARAAEVVEASVASGDTDVFLQVYHHERQHVVQPGETLVSIAREYGFPYMWVAQANPGLGDSLSVGQVLAIPSPDVLLPLPVVDGKRIVVSITEQRVWVYENGTLKWEWLASTGIAESPTNPGVFQVQTHEENAYAANWDLWMPYFLGIYQPVPGADFMNGFHGFPARGGTTILWTRHLGRPVTYGCILLSTEDAALLYDWAEEGTVVEIQQ